MERTEHVELTVLCLLYQGDQYLLQNRVKADWQGYALPGGHVEKGESVVDAVIREMKEETGLRIFHPVLCGIKQFPREDGRYLVFLFKTDSFEGQLRASEEGSMHWVKKAELPALKTVDDLETLLEVMLREDLTEFQYVIDHGQWNVVIK